MLIIALWILQSIYSFYMLCTAFRYDFDVTLGTAIFFSFVSLLPICFIIATIVFLIEYPWGKQIVVFKKFE